jgi:nitrate reductase NapE component
MMGVGSFGGNMAGSFMTMRNISNASGNPNNDDNNMIIFAIATMTIFTIMIIAIALIFGR